MVIVTDRSASPNRPQQPDSTSYYQVLEVFNAHQKFFLGNDIDISYPLYTSWHRKGTDPRDKIYVHLGLVRELDMEIDYSSSVAQVYTRFAKSAILSFRSVDILRGKRWTESEYGLPSWVPDWTAESQQNFPSAAEYLAAGTLGHFCHILAKESSLSKALSSM